MTDWRHKQNGVCYWNWFECLAGGVSMSIKHRPFFLFLSLSFCFASKTLLFISSEWLTEVRLYSWRICNTKNRNKSNFTLFYVLFLMFSFCCLFWPFIWDDVNCISLWFCIFLAVPFACFQWVYRNIVVVCFDSWLLFWGCVDNVCTPNIGKIERGNVNNKHDKNTQYSCWFYQSSSIICKTISKAIKFPNFFSVNNKNEQNMQFTRIDWQMMTNTTILCGLEIQPKKSTVWLNWADQIKLIFLNSIIWFSSNPANATHFE